MAESTRALIEVARTVLGELDLEVVLDRVLTSARDLTGARYAALGVLDESRRRLARFLTLGIDDETVATIGPFPTGRGVLGELITHPVPLRIDDVGSHPRSYGFPSGHPPMRSFLGVPVFVGGEPFGNLYLTEKAGAKRFSDQDEEVLIELAGLAGMAIDHARRFTGSEQRRIELQRTVDALEATIEIARSLAGQTDIDAILQLVAKRGRALVDARLLVIEVQEGPELAVRAAAGELPAGFIGQRMQLKDTVASTAIRTRQTQRLSDPLNWSRFQRYGAGRFGLGARDGLVVPLSFRGETYGVLVALDHLEGDASFTVEHERLLESFAASAAMAVASAYSAAAERRRQAVAAAESERTRWARELHDETLQAIAGVKLMLSAARRQPDAEAMVRAIDDAIMRLQSDMDDLRALIADLRPGALDELGLEPAILDLVERVQAAGVEVDAQLDLAFERGEDPTRLESELETAIYRTVQEALTNVLKHSEARRVVVELVEDASRATLTVRDDGCGFDAGEATTGFGLVGMRERVLLVDGVLDVSSARGEGTRISATFPARHRRPHATPPPLASDG
jgi:signal transduction histidine kinase